MREVFADTGYWIGAMNPRDPMHMRTKQISSKPFWQRIVTSEWVLLEFLNYFSDMGQYLRTSSANAVLSLRRTPNIEIISQSTGDFTEALSLYQQRPDKAWSLTDCSSFLIMQQRNIDAALTFDHHFEQAGFKALMRH